MASYNFEGVWLECIVYPEARIGTDSDSTITLEGVPLGQPLEPIPLVLITRAHKETCLTCMTIYICTHVATTIVQLQLLCSYKIKTI